MSTQAESARYALVTPSYAPDFERCALLCESVDRHAAPEIVHHLIVGKCDERRFSILRGRRTRLHLAEDVLPRWLCQVPWWPKWWVSFRGRPTRGWIVQQIVKLSAPSFTGADVLINVDSDVMLVRDFDPCSAERDGAVPLFRETIPTPSDMLARWHATAADALGLPPDPGCPISYVTQLVTWRRDTVIALQRHIERVTGKGWVESLLRYDTMSEYVLYGAFCERVLGERSGHFADSTIRTQNHWDTNSLDEHALAELRSHIRPEHWGVMISAKSSTDMRAIRRAFAGAAVTPA